MTGVTVGGVGYTEVEGTAEVRFLKKIEDFRVPITVSVLAVRLDPVPVHRARA